MPDYIYLLENRLSPSQQSALLSIREAAREAGMTVFLTGGAVRDLTSGSPVRDIDVSVQGNALELKPKLQSTGAVLWGEHEPSQTFFARFPGSVRVEISSTRREDFPKPGQPVYHPGSILEDLRRRDFTANAMALSLNEGSYGLLMDPLNGVADLEARLLRLVSNYGFLEDPVRMIRAARLQARLGWEIEEKTKVRLENAREEGVISHISSYQQGYELEEILHEEDGLKILKALEAEGWMKVLCPAWTSAKVDTEALEALREVLVQLQMQGVNPDPSAAQAQLLTAKLPAKDLASLKKTFVRQGFVKEWDSQDERAKDFGKRLTSKEAATPSAAWKLLTTSDPEAVLWLGLTSKSAPVQEKLKDFFNVWPEARQRIPYVLMQEMRITPELEGYQDLLKAIFFELIDGKLTTDEEIRQFLEPHSPPAPPPPVTIRRTRAKKSADKGRAAREVEDDEAPSRTRGEDEDADDLDDESEPADERGELIARSGPQLVPPLRFPEPADSIPDAEPEPVAPSAAAGPAPRVDPPEPENPSAPASKVPEVKVISAPATEAKSAAAKIPAKPVADPRTRKAPEPAKAASKVDSAKTAPKTAVRAASKAAPKEIAKAASKTKPAAKPSARTKPAAKKTAAKPAPKPALRKVVSKSKPAKAAVKTKAPLKVKPAAKLKPQAKKPAKPVTKGAPAKKKKR